MAALSPSKAQTPQITYTITPSHVYQSTEEFRLQLENLGLIDNSIYESAQPDRALRHPRHVIQKVRECHTILSKILLARGLELEPVPGLFSSREIRPADVRNGVQHLLKDVEKLGEKTSEPVPYVEGKLPGDVYNNLKRICEAVNVETVASDVYQVVLAVLKNWNIPQRDSEKRRREFSQPWYTLCGVAEYVFQGRG